MSHSRNPPRQQHRRYAEDASESEESDYSDSSYSEPHPGNSSELSEEGSESSGDISTSSSVSEDARIQPNARIRYERDRNDYVSEHHQDRLQASSSRLRVSHHAGHNDRNAERGDFRGSNSNQYRRQRQAYLPEHTKSSWLSRITSIPSSLVAFLTSFLVGIYRAFKLITHGFSQVHSLLISSSHELRRLRAAFPDLGKTLFVLTLAWSLSYLLGKTTETYVKSNILTHVCSFPKEYLSKRTEILSQAGITGDSEKIVGLAVDDDNRLRKRKKSSTGLRPPPDIVRIIKIPELSRNGSCARVLLKDPASSLKKSFGDFPDIMLGGEYETAVQTVAEVIFAMNVVLQLSRMYRIPYVHRPMINILDVDGNTFDYMEHSLNLGMDEIRLTDVLPHLDSIRRIDIQSDDAVLSQIVNIPAELRAREKILLWRSISTTPSRSRSFGWTGAWLRSKYRCSKLKQEPYSLFDPANMNFAFHLDMKGNLTFDLGVESILVFLSYLRAYQPGMIENGHIGIQMYLEVDRLATTFDPHDPGSGKTQIPGAVEDSITPSLSRKGQAQAMAGTTPQFIVDLSVARLKQKRDFFLQQQIKLRARLEQKLFMFGRIKADVQVYMFTPDLISKPMTMLKHMIEADVLVIPSVTDFALTAAVFSRNVKVVPAERIKLFYGCTFLVPTLTHEELQHLNEVYKQKFKATTGKFPHQVVLADAPRFGINMPVLHEKWRARFG